MSKYEVKPVYIKALIIMIALYVANMTFILADLYYKIGNVEHVLVHMHQGDICHKR